MHTYCTNKIINRAKVLLAFCERLVLELFAKSKAKYHNSGKQSVLGTSRVSVSWLG